MLLKFHMLVYRCGFRYCIQTSNRILVPVLCVVLPGVGGKFSHFPSEACRSKQVVYCCLCWMHICWFYKWDLNHNARNYNVQDTKIFYSAYLQSIPVNISHASYEKNASFGSTGSLGIDSWNHLQCRLFPPQSELCCCNYRHPPILRRRLLRHRQYQSRRRKLRQISP